LKTQPVHITVPRIAAVKFVLKLLILQLFLKFIFGIYNYGLLEDAFHPVFSRLPGLLFWAVVTELLVICVINFPFLIFFSCITPTAKTVGVRFIVMWVMILVNVGNAGITLFDIFYFHFQRQRANADLLYVINRPWDQSFGEHPWLSIIGLLLILALVIALWRFSVSYLSFTRRGKQLPVFAFGTGFVIFLFVLFRADLLLPTASLRNLNTSGTSIVQNSLQSFLFSVYRSKEAQLPPLFPPKGNTTPYAIRSVPFAPEGMKGKNVVLFIMESIPAEFFMEGAPHKVSMPFLDSLVKRSRYFSHAYSFGHNSNKGITSILAGLPTLTEIPLYHSAFAGLPKSGIGDVLADHGYGSAFFIGDHYDDFGFAKCCNWLGIRHYFSRESIHGYKTLPSNSMGLQDEFVLRFMHTVMDTLKQPFLSVNYNTSTHYPNDIPEAFSKSQPKSNFTPEMRSMAYYSECLRKFFEEAKTKNWYKNTVFIFCSDHWMYPDVKHLNNDVVESFHIPVFIFDPSDPVQLNISYPVSQLDVSSTILGIAGVGSPVINYGESLFLPQEMRRPYVVCKENNILYEVIDSARVLGYNAQTGRPEFFYDFVYDPEMKINKVKDSSSTSIYIQWIRDFLETAVNHYRGNFE